MLRASSRLSAALLLPLALAACVADGSWDKPSLAVNVPATCEQLLRRVPHGKETGAVVEGVTDARVAYKIEFNNVDTANERMNSARGCLARQREKFAKGGD